MNFVKNIYEVEIKIRNLIKNDNRTCIKFLYLFLSLYIIVCDGICLNVIYCVVKIQNINLNVEINKSFRFIVDVICILCFTIAFNFGSHK